MPDFRIDLLQLNIEDAVGHEHRIQPIAKRAAEILAATLEHRHADQASASPLNLNAVTAPALNLDLGHTGDEAAAQQIAGAWFDALALHLKA